MTYTGSEDHSISLNDAAEMTQRYRENPPSDEPVIAEYFGKDAINAILAQEGAVGIRIYYALDDEMIQKLVIVGVDSNGEDLYQGELAERGWTSPPFGLSSNALNS